jgi:hypothetical protein
MRRAFMQECAVGWPSGVAPLRRPAAGDRGAVLLETALAIPLLAAVAVALAWGVSLGATSMALGDAARTAARDLARGEPVAQVLDQARAQAPGASVRVEDAGDSVLVIVDREVSAPVPILRGITLTVHQQVAVPREWS